MSARPEFSHAHAREYDSRWKGLAPTMHGLHFLMKVLLSKLPSDAHILCVGAGTGAEILVLAEKFPSWRFTAVDPSGDMLAVCRAKMEERGYAARCDYHAGYLSTFQCMRKYDAATAILVSHFITDDHQRKKFFDDIAERLKPNAYLINADLTSPETSMAFDLNLEAWVQMLQFAGGIESSTEQVLASWKNNVSLSTPEQMEATLKSSGFRNPTAFYQSLFIRAWCSKGPA